MTAWLLDALQGIDTLRAGQIDAPVAGRGEVVLKVICAALNPADRYLAEKQYPARPEFPHILGRDGIGTVIAVGEGVSAVRVGEKKIILRSEVGVSRRGTLAAQVAVPAESVVSLPHGWSDEQGAAGPLVYLTAYQALWQWGELDSAVVLITGATGGVGVASVQLAKAMGHTAIGLSRSAEKGEMLRRLGADFVVSPEDREWRKRVKEFLQDRRVDLAIDNIGGSLFSELLDVMGEHGRISVVGRLAGEVPNFNTAALFFRRLRIGGVAVGSYTAAESRAAWDQVIRLLETTGAKPVIDSIHAFDQVPEAFERMRLGPMGKVVIRIAE